MANNLVDIDHLAYLARIELTEEEKATIAPQLESILTYISKLSVVDTSGVPESAYITDAKNVFRADVVTACDLDTVSRCIEAFPKKIGTALSVPGIFEERTE